MEHEVIVLSEIRRQRQLADGFTQGWTKNQNLDEREWSEIKASQTR